MDRNLFFVDAVPCAIRTITSSANPVGKNSVEELWRYGYITSFRKSQCTILNVDHILTLIKIKSHSCYGVRAMMLLFYKRLNRYWEWVYCKNIE